MAPIQLRCSAQNDQPTMLRPCMSIAQTHLLTSQLRAALTLSDRVALVLLLVWLFPLCGCYRINSGSNNPVSNLPEDATYRLHSERQPALYAVCGNSTGIIWAFGDHGAAYISSGGGRNWQLSTSLPGTINDCIDYQGSFLVVSASGKIYRRSEDASWVALDSRTDSRLSSIIALPDNGLVVGGDQGTIRYSTDGRSWVSRNLGTPANVRSLASCGHRVWASTSDGHLWSFGK